MFFWFLFFYLWLVWAFFGTRIGRIFKIVLIFEIVFGINNFFGTRIERIERIFKIDVVFDIEIVIEIDNFFGTRITRIEGIFKIDAVFDIEIVLEIVIEIEKCCPSPDCNGKLFANLV